MEKCSDLMTISKISRKCKPKINLFLSHIVFAQVYYKNRKKLIVREENFGSDLAQVHRVRGLKCMVSLEVAT